MRNEAEQALHYSIRLTFARYFFAMGVANNLNILLPQFQQLLR